jgi:moderate conductance mechanosensitive channel
MRRCSLAGALLALAGLGLAGPAGAQDAPPALAGTLWVSFPEVAAEWTALASGLADAFSNAVLLRDFTLLLILAMTAGGSEILYWCYAMPALRAIEAADPVEPARRLPIGLQRLLLRLLGIAVGVAALYGATLVLAWPDMVREIAFAVVAGVAGSRIVRALADFVLSPRRERFRLWPAGDEASRARYRRITRIALVTAAGLISSRILAILGAPILEEIVESLVATLVAFLLLRAIGAWSRQRKALAASRRRTLGDLLPFGAAVLVLGGLVLFLAGEHTMVWTIAVVALLVLADRTAGGILSTAFGFGEAQTSPGAAMAAAYLPVIRRLVRFALAIIAFIAILAIWNINVLMEPSTDMPAAHALGQAVNVAVVILLCDLAWIAVRTAINRHLVAMPSQEGEAASRLSTLLPMIRTSVLIVLIGIAALVTLSAMGVNIAPLLAGAGVVGLAIGFGAQTLVRDVITGVFFLIEDAFRVGEYIDVGTRKGTVEAISLRSLRLRHQRGALHTVPFGEIKSLSNESRDWSIVKLEFRIPFDTDLGRIKKIIKTINAEIMADPELGPNLIDPIKSQGINRFEEYWMVLRVKFTARPNSYQFMIRREAYHRIRDAFDKAGIKLGERSVKVQVDRQGQEVAAAGGALGEDSE